MTAVIEAASVNVRTDRITANAATSTTVQVIVTTGVTTVLGISVLGPGVPAARVTVHAVAVAVS